MIIERIVWVSKLKDVKNYLFSLNEWFIILTHFSLASLFWDLGKQYRPRSDATERGVWLEASLFANRNFYPKKNKNETVHQTPLKLEMDSPNS